MTPITKIISGGQTGADHGGVLSARRAGVATGGYMPRGWLTEAGPRADAATYGYQEHRAYGYGPRTVSNVKAADVTLLFGDSSSPGSRLTRRTCEKWHPCICLDEFDDRMLDTVTAILSVIRPRRPPGLVVNVAGNRESKNPGIEAKVADFVYRLCFKLNGVVGSEGGIYRYEEIRR